MNWAYLFLPLPWRLNEKYVIKKKQLQRFCKEVIALYLICCILVCQIATIWLTRFCLQVDLFLSYSATILITSFFYSYERRLKFFYCYHDDIYENVHIKTRCKVFALDILIRKFFHIIKAHLSIETLHIIVTPSIWIPIHKLWKAAT
jgi:hypothetical protein